jgi:hypothetical protein
MINFSILMLHAKVYHWAGAAALGSAAPLIVIQSKTPPIIRGHFYVKLYVHI